MPANGDAFGGKSLQGEINYHALVDQTAATDGAWFNTSGVITSSLHVIGLAIGESLAIHISNAPSEPDVADAGVAAQTITGDGNEKLVAYSRWKKVKKVGAVGAVNAYYSGVKR
jgi:hypothetical protein